MNAKFKCLLLPFLIWDMAVSAESYNSLVIVHLDGQEAVHALSVIGRIEFTQDSLFLVSNQGIILGRENKDSVQNIAFRADSTTTDVSEVKIGNSIQIYPNPVLQTLIIKGAKTNEVIRIYSLNGNLIASAIVYDEQHSAIDVSGLPVGQYLLQINTQIMKLIKQ